MNSNSIIIEPILTEKSTELRKQMNKYCFRVNSKANKDQIIKAFRDIFKVDVLTCNIMNISGKKKRVRYRQGYTSSWKKAIITIKEGQALEFFAGM